jgi:hypothetical protein
MLAGPSAIPVTTPLASTVALAVLLLLHTPPEVTLARVVTAPIQTDDAPVIAGTEPTVILVVVKQPVPEVKVMVATPALTQFRTPEPEIDATDALLLLQDTPDALLVSVALDPTHTNDGPPIPGGVGLTVNRIVRAQPVPRV